MQSDHMVAYLLEFLKVGEGMKLNTWALTLLIKWCIIFKKSSNISPRIRAFSLVQRELYSSISSDNLGAIKCTTRRTIKGCEENRKKVLNFTSQGMDT